MGNIVGYFSIGWRRNVPPATETSTVQPRSPSQSVVNQSVSSASKSKPSSSRTMAEPHRSGGKPSRQQTTSFTMDRPFVQLSNQPIILSFAIYLQIYLSNMCFFDIQRDRNLTVVKMDVAWWMEAAPPQIIFPEKPSTCPVLETILEERETEKDDHEHVKDDV
ncbi:unnamed protein product [Brassica oleracea]|uniref:Uncharacterized protein n=1 Tax=Brassica oleracea TaxID=3712 RepID=A0A3P6EM23_BRAOL|nr:unnamed protein product [Brassica oleracea]